MHGCRPDEISPATFAVQYSDFVKAAAAIFFRNFQFFSILQSFGKILWAIQQALDD